MEAPWICKNCGVDVESNFTHCWSCGASKAGALPVSVSNQQNMSQGTTKTGNPSFNHNQMNKVVTVNLTGGIIGMLSSSPNNALNARIRKENLDGWKVVQIIPADSGNLFLFAVRLFLLIVTCFLFTISNGYYIVMERK